MTNLARIVALLITIAVVCPACANDSSSPTASGSTRSSAPSSAAGAVPPPPRVGQCRNTPSSRLDQWVDDTPVVDCSKTHTLETVAVIKPAMKLTLALVKQLAASCESPAVDYLGIASREVRTIDDQVVYWPSRAQRMAGQTWVRCDAGVREPTYCCGHLVPQTGSLRGAVAKDPVRFQMCTNELPRPEREQPLTSCKKPHRTEVLPTGLQMDVTRYPSAEALSNDGRRECAKLVSQRKDLKSLVVRSSWQSRASWSGATLYGWCWIHRDTGLMPPIR
jgi:hypothetical protein